MQLRKFIVITFTCCLIFGILLAFYIPFSSKTILGVSILLIAILFVIHYAFRKQKMKSILFGCITYLCFIFLGILTHHFHEQHVFTRHYTKINISKSEVNSIIMFRVASILKPTNYHNKYVIDILKLNDKNVTGKLLLNINKDSTKHSLQIDAIYNTKTLLQQLPIPKNPYQFNYKNYLENQHIYHQLYANNSSLFLVKNSKYTLSGYAALLRKTINERLKLFNFKNEELSIINALLLGQRQGIDKSIYDNYINAGAIHILAVSGLHVGIVLLLLNFLLKPLEYLKHGRFLKTILIVIILWSFAVVAGLSASVTRAVTMFSIVTIGMNLKRPTNIYNTLAISMFILLLLKPQFIFDVGFQLSYIAVFAIVWIQPLLYNFWQPKSKLLRLFWNIFTVTTAAQIGVIPISIYYFHQFPGLFFVSNLIIIPFLGVILGLGFFVICLALLDCLPTFIAKFYGNIISYLNYFIAWVAEQEQFLIKDISFNLWLLFPIYLLIIAMVSLLKKTNYQRLIFALTSIIILLGILIYKKHQTVPESFIIFNKSRYTMIGRQINKELIFSHNLDSLTKSKDNTIRNYKVGSFVKSIKEDSIQDFYSINNNMLLIIDSLGVYNTKTLKPTYVLLRNSPKVNLQRLIDSIAPKLIIADGSNYKSYVARWKETCRSKKLPFHYTYEKGAYIFK